MIIKGKRLLSMTKNTNSFNRVIHKKISQEEEIRIKSHY